MQFGLFSPKGLRSIDESTARLNVWHGAVRSSKTVCSVVRLLEFIKQAPPGDIILIGKTERTLKRNILGLVEEIVGPKRFRHIQGAGEVWIFGRRCYTAGANDEKAAGKIRGMTLVGAYCDEVTLWPESMFKELLNRLSVKGAQLFATTNPDGPFHWFKRDFLDREHELNLRSWHFELDDNPNLDPEYIRSLKSEHSGVFYQRMIQGLWVMAEGAIYDQFDIGRHGFGDENAPSDVQARYVALDYGTQNPFAALLIAVSATGTAYVERELYYSGRDNQRQLTDAEYSKRLRGFLGDIRPKKVIVDPSAASFIAQLRQDGFSPIQKADNDVLNGIRSVSNALNNGKLLIHRKNCPHLIREFSSYSWDIKAGEKGEDKPIKVNDHALDALRYYVHTMSKGKAEAIATGIDLY